MTRSSLIGSLIMVTSAFGAPAVAPSGASAPAVSAPTVVRVGPTAWHAERGDVVEIVAFDFQTLANTAWAPEDFAEWLRRVPADVELVLGGEFLVSQAVAMISQEPWHHEPAPHAMDARARIELRRDGSSRHTLIVLSGGSLFDPETPTIVYESKDGRELLRRLVGLTSPVLSDSPPLSAPPDH